MTPRIDQMKQGTCGCGRSPTGNCIGWHGLSEELFRARLVEFNTKQQTLTSPSVKDSQQSE